MSEYLNTKAILRLEDRRRQQRRRDAFDRLRNLVNPERVQRLITEYEVSGDHACRPGQCGGDCVLFAANKVLNALK